MLSIPAYDVERRSTRRLPGSGQGSGLGNTSPLADHPRWAGARESHLQERHRIAFNSVQLWRGALVVLVSGSQLRPPVPNPVRSDGWRWHVGLPEVLPAHLRDSAEIAG